LTTDTTIRQEKRPDKTLISIVTVTWNAGSTLPLTFDGMAALTIPEGLELEYLVVDGASSDATVGLIRSAAGEGPGPAWRRSDGSPLVDRWVSEKDAGIYDAMNKAVRMATGDWVLFMNAGDRFETNNALELAKPFLLSGTGSKQQPETNATAGFDVVYGDAMPVYPDGTPHYDHSLAPARIRYRMVCSHQSLFARRELLLSHPFNLRFRVCADHYFLMQVIREGARVGRIAVPLGRVQLERYTWEQTRKGHAEKLKMVRELWPGIKPEIYQAARFVRLALARVVKGLLKR